MAVFGIKVLLMNHKFEKPAAMRILRRFFKLRHIGLRLRRQIHYAIDFRIRNVEIAVIPKVARADMRHKFRRVTVRYVRSPFPVDIETPRKIPIADLSERGHSLRRQIAEMDRRLVRQRPFPRKTHDLPMHGQTVGCNDLCICVPIRETRILFSGMERQIQPIRVFFPLFTECVRHHCQVKIRRIRCEPLEILRFVKEVQMYLCAVLFMRLAIQGKIRIFKYGAIFACMLRDVFQKQNVVVGRQSVPLFRMPQTPHRNFRPVCAAADRLQNRFAETKRNFRNKFLSVFFAEIPLTVIISALLLTLTGTISSAPLIFPSAEFRQSPSRGNKNVISPLPK